jgi:hypothetical protein
VRIQLRVGCGILSDAAAPILFQITAMRTISAPNESAAMIRISTIIMCSDISLAPYPRISCYGMNAGMTAESLADPASSVNVGNFPITWPASHPANED